LVVSSDKAGSEVVTMARLQKRVGGRRKRRKGMDKFVWIIKSGAAAGLGRGRAGAVPPYWGE
jgi:hypothetical protein